MVEAGGRTVFAGTITHYLCARLPVAGGRRSPGVRLGAGIGHRVGAGEFGRVKLDRRSFLKLVGSASIVALPGCHDSARYSEADAAALERHWREEHARSGTGPYGVQRFRGYRGLAELPYFELDPAGTLRCTVDDLPEIVDIHAHLGMSLFLAPELDLEVRTPRVRHYLDCDGTTPGCAFDLDVYANANFSDAGLRALRWSVVAQLLWGSRVAATHTVPNLLAEMDAVRIAQAVILPIAFGLPFGDELYERWRGAITRAGARGRLLMGASVHPRDPLAVEKLTRYAAEGALILKLHPAGQRFFPDSPEVAPVYETCEALGLPVIFHGGRAGIEPEYSQPFNLIRHYEGAFRDFPGVQFVLAHAGARDVAGAIPLAQRYPNVWLGIHGQGVTVLSQLIDEVGAQRLLFGTDWPFYHLAATLAKVLLVTDGRPELRNQILRANAERLLAI